MARRPLQDSGFTWAFDPNQPGARCNYSWGWNRITPLKVWNDAGMGIKHQERVDHGIENQNTLHFQLFTGKVVKCLARGHKCHGRDSNTHSAVLLLTRNLEQRTNFTQLSRLMKSVFNKGVWATTVNWYGTCSTVWNTILNTIICTECHQLIKTMRNSATKRQCFLYVVLTGRIE